MAPETAAADEGILDRELKTYQQHREELLGQAAGKFVLIHGDDIVGAFDAKQDAIGEGFKQFGNSPFLVKQVVVVETPQNFVSNQLAI